MGRYNDYSRLQQQQHNWYFLLHNFRRVLVKDRYFRHALCIRELFKMSIHTNYTGLGSILSYINPHKILAHNTLYRWYKNNNNNNKTGVAFKVRYDIYHFKALIFVFKEFCSSSVQYHIWAKGNDNNKHKFRIIFNHSTTIILSYVLCMVIQKIQYL